jgi:hypothetical protein
MVADFPRRKKTMASSNESEQSGKLTFAKAMSAVHRRLLASGVRAMDVVLRPHDGPVSHQEYSHLLLKELVRLGCPYEGKDLMSDADEENFYGITLPERCETRYKQKT